MAASDSEDEELKRAIALSLRNETLPLLNSAPPINTRQDPKRGEADQAVSRPDQCTLAASDSEDEELKRAIVLSLENDARPPLSSAPTIMTEQEPKLGMVGQAVSMPERLPFSGLDRKAMEQERLARLAARNGKRARSISPPLLSRPAKAPRIDSASSQHPAKSSLPNKSGLGDGQPSHSILPPSTDSARIEYPLGAVKQTWALGHERTPSDIKIEEVLQRQTLRTAVLSAFQWDTDWILSKVNFPATKLIFVMQGKDKETRDHALSQTENVRDSLKICFPPMEGQTNCMHSKLMLLFHPHKLRIVVPSANLTSYDWGETGIMENSVFLIDLPRRLPPDVPDSRLATPFCRELMFFLEKQGLDETVRQSLLSFDFANTSHLAFVHALGGVSYGANVRRTGFMGLSQAITELGLKTSPASLQLDFAASSIGSLNEDFLRIVHEAAQGNDMTGRLQAIQKPPSRSKTRPPDSPSTPITVDLESQFRIYFPTLDSVRASTGGTRNGGTICLQRSWFEGDKFPRACFREHESVRNGLLSHNKLLYARGHAERNGRQESIAWVYVGSANLSESAWGKITLDRQRKEIKMSCRNWECGVVLSVPGRLDGIGDGLEVFEDLIRVPFVLPGKVYGGREPWYFREH